MITLYQTEWCPHGHRVRQLMTELGLTYTTVNVAFDPEGRPDLVAISGQSGVPVLQDGDKVLHSSDEIVEYLRATYPAPEDAAEHEGKGRWRMSQALSLAPRAALARLKELLESRGFAVVGQVFGPEIAEDLPDGYVLLHVAVPAAAVRAFELDREAPAAILLPVAVMPADGGGSLVTSADPVAQVWLYGEPALTKVQSAVKKRLVELFKEL